MGGPPPHSVYSVPSVRPVRSVRSVPSVPSEFSEESCCFPSERQSILSAGGRVWEQGIEGEDGERTVGRREEGSLNSGFRIPNSGFRIPNLEKRAGEAKRRGAI